MPPDVAEHHSKYAEGCSTGGNFHFLLQTDAVAVGNASGLRIAAGFGDTAGFGEHCRAWQQCRAKTPSSIANGSQVPYEHQRHHKGAQCASAATII